MVVTQTYMRAGGRERVSIILHFSWKFNKPVFCVEVRSCARSQACLLCSTEIIRTESWNTLLTKGSELWAYLGFTRILLYFYSVDGIHVLRERLMPTCHRIMKFHPLILTTARMYGCVY